ncbi:hypothetical protein M758_12G130800 [Ceratodon purpureus]|nr:hypothetical protein M758_12G130800 [Ceratodon purpureus]
MTTNTVRVTNVSAKATAHDIHDFFSFSGEIENIDLHRDGDTQIALVTFKEAQALDTALLLSGATVVDRAVNISPVEDELSPSMNSVPREQMFGNDRGSSGTGNPNQAVEVIATMLAKGFVLGKDAVGKAKEFDEKHDLSSSAKSSVVNFDKNTGISEKLSAGTAVVNQQMKAVDEKFQVTEKTRAALAVAEEKVATAGSALMKNRYILTGATWVTGAFSRVQKAAAEVSQKAKEKATAMESEQNKGHTHEETHSSSFADSYGAPPPYPAAERATLAPTSASTQYPNLGYDHYSPLHSTDPRSTRTPSQGLML